MTTWLRRMPLQVKLVAAVLALVTAALLVISVVSAVALRSYLTNQVDEQLLDTVERMQLQGTPSENRTRTLLPSDFVVHWQYQVPILVHDQRYASDDLPPLPQGQAEAADMADVPHTVDSVNGELRWRMLSTVLPNGSVLTLAQDMSAVNSAVSRLIWIEVLVGTAVLLSAAALGAASVQISLRPLVKIEHTAEAIANGDLTRRVPQPDPAAASTEVGRLATALNTMLAQIEAAFTDRAASEERARHSEERMRQFVADASHELRTPLTTIRGFAELYRQGAAREPEETGALLRRIEGEASRMGVLVEDLLLLARLDQERPLRLAPVELAPVVTDAVLAARARDPEREIGLAIDPEAGPLVVAGDDARLGQIVGNLLTNALTHTPPGSPVAARLRAADGFGVIEVADQGRGLTAEQAERVFERFYRVDTARGRPVAVPGGAAGTGLGLAIVAALVVAHRGTVEVDSTPGQGATFRVRLPLAYAGDDDARKSATGRAAGRSGKV